MASDVLPEPDTPTTATVRHSGTSTSISRRLLCRAPRTLMAAGRVSGTGNSTASIKATYAGRAGQGARHWRVARPRPGPHQGRRSPSGAFWSRVERSAWPAVEADRLQDSERGGSGEHLDT